MILGAGFGAIRILDPHSEVACKILNAKGVLPHQLVSRALHSRPIDGTRIVAPDAGSINRIAFYMNVIGQWPTTYGLKHRDSATGVITKIGVIDPGGVVGKDCLIVDDICDGGGTFTGLAKELLRWGARKVNLFVTHGVFSKGTNLEGIDTIYTTDPYQDGFEGSGNVVVFPVNMKEMV